MINQKTYIQTHLKQITAIFIAVVYVVSLFSVKNYKYGNTPIREDAAGYYCYLPSIFIYKDLNSQYLLHYNNSEFMKNHIEEYNYLPERWFLYRAENGKWVTKFSCGVAVCELPFFGIACLLSKIFDYPVDGYSFFFKLMFKLCTLIFSFLGLYILFKLLRTYFSEVVSSIVVLIIAMATNYYYYASIITGMGHIFNFCFAAALLYNWLIFLENFSIKNFNLSFFLMGMIVLVRPTDCVFAIFLGLLLILEGKLPQFWDFIKTSKLKILISFLCFFAPLSLQMIFWKLAAGKFVFYSYGDEGFDFLHPHILGGLFSFKKGWLIYTPVMIFAFFGLKFCKKSFNISLLITLLIHWWIVFSWWSWWYGGSFGCRVMILFYPVLALSLGRLLENIKTKKLAYLATFLIAFFMFWNVLQSYQIQKGILHYEETNWEMYKNSLFRIR